MDAYIQANAYLVYALVMIAAALLHWGQKVRKGEATGNFVDYWVTETPGYSLGTLGALIGAWWIIMTTNGLAGMASHMVIEGAFATGWAINSAVAPGSSAGKIVNDAKNAAAGFVRLSMLPWLAVIAACVMLLGGCGGMLDVHKTDPAVVLTVQQKAQNAIDESNAAIAAGAQTVLAQTQAGAISKADEATYADQLNKATKAVDASQAALDIGDLSTQAGQLAAAQVIIDALQAKLIAIKNGK